MTNSNPDLYRRHPLLIDTNDDGSFWSDHHRRVDQDESYWLSSAMRTVASHRDEAATGAALRNLAGGATRR